MQLHSSSTDEDISSIEDDVSARPSNSSTSSTLEDTDAIEEDVSAGPSLSSDSSNVEDTDAIEEVSAGSPSAPSPVSIETHQASSSVSKTGVKVDHGMKLYLRFWRDGLISLFIRKGFGVGLHHWKVEKWLVKAQAFANSVLGYDLPFDQLCGLIILLYSAFGAAATKKDPKKVPKKGTKKDTKKPPKNPAAARAKLAVYHGLGNDTRTKEQKLVIYHTIFSNNNKQMRDAFFRDDLIRAFYPHVLPQIIYESCFFKYGKEEGPNATLVPSFREVTRIIIEDYKLPMPAWWAAMF